MLDGLELISTLVSLRRVDVVMTRSPPKSVTSSPPKSVTSSPPKSVTSSPLNTFGARLNLLLSRYSMSSLVVCGNIRLTSPSICVKDLGTDNNAVYICTNKMCFTQKIYPDLSAEYKRKYAQWMDRAISYFIEYVDGMPEPCTLFGDTNNAETFVDVTLYGGDGRCVPKKTRVRAFLTREAADMYEFVFDTAYHDQGSF